MELGLWVDGWYDVGFWKWVGSEGFWSWVANWKTLWAEFGCCRVGVRSGLRALKAGYCDGEDIFRCSLC